MDVHLAAREQEVLDPADVVPDHEAGGHRGEQIEADDAAVDPAEVAQAGLRRTTRARRPGRSRPCAAPSELHVFVRVVAARALRAEEQRRDPEALVDEGVARPLRGGDPRLRADDSLRRAEQARGPRVVGRLLVAVERRVEHALEARRVTAEERVGCAGIVGARPRPRAAPPRRPRRAGTGSTPGSARAAGRSTAPRDRRCSPRRRAPGRAPGRGSRRRVPRSARRACGARPSRRPSPARGPSARPGSRPPRGRSSPSGPPRRRRRRRPSRRASRGSPRSSCPRRSRRRRPGRRAGGPASVPPPPPNSSSTIDSHTRSPRSRTPLASGPPRPRTARRGRPSCPSCPARRAVHRSRRPRTARRASRACGRAGTVSTWPLSSRLRPPPVPGSARDEVAPTAVAAVAARERVLRALEKAVS